jgi:hypothetical protein
MPGLAWTTGARAAPGRVYSLYSKGVRVAAGLVWTTGAYTAPGVSTLQGPELHLNVHT